MFESSSEVKEKELKGLIERNVHAAKGDAGRVLVIGGSERYVGSAVLAGLAAFRAGVDSVLIAAPEQSARLMNAFSPDLITVKLKGEQLYEDHLEELVELSRKASVVLVGPGLGVSKEIAAWLRTLLPKLEAPVVLDADATKQALLGDIEHAILLANKKEYALFKQNNMQKGASTLSFGSNILIIKGKDDVIHSEAGERLVTGGHLRATVAGTGDVLAGLVAGCYAQVKEPGKAAAVGALLAKKTAEKIAEKGHFGWLASDMVEAIPMVMKELRCFRVTKYVPNGKSKK